MTPTDCDVLLAIYEATNGPKWKDSSNWGTDADLSDWYGVKVNEQGRVVTLALTANNLRGISRPTLRTPCFARLQCVRPFPKLLQPRVIMLLMKGQVLQEATTLSCVPAFCTRLTPEYPPYICTGRSTSSLCVRCCCIRQSESIPTPPLACSLNTRHIDTTSFLAFKCFWYTAVVRYRLFCRAWMRFCRTPGFWENICLLRVQASVSSHIEHR